nr:CMRF35-like molecule 4 isoform X1 [Microcebus murinus]
MWLCPALLLVILSGYSTAENLLTGPGAARGRERGSLTVQCRYEPGWETHRKWWCRGADFRSCRILVMTTGSEQEVRRDRVSIRDRHKNHTFTVTMEELRRDDADTYWCGIERTGIDLSVPVEVTIDPGYSTSSNPLTGPGAARGRERGSLTVQCRYEPGLERHRKWWCRGAHWRSCRILVMTTGSEQEVKKDRVSIRDSHKNHTFTVTMEELRRDDADTYWCGIERTGIDFAVPVEVTIAPAPGRTTMAASVAFTPSTSMKTTSSVTRSLLGSTYFLLLVLLELPLILSMLGVVLWVNRPWRGSAGRPGRRDDENR